MKIKEQVLTALETHRGHYISGSELAKDLEVSRNAVWKAIKQLQEEGHQIGAATNRGYCLSAGNTVLSRQSIEKHLTVDPLFLEVHASVSSTNTLLKQRAEEGAPEGTVLIAEEQTQGRGRRNHTFYSPHGTGIYMSLLLRPPFSASESLCITTCAAVAVAKAIEHNAGIPAEIKWVNDIYCGGKKVCGILTEASLDLESGGLHYAILGIGINVFPPKQSFPDEIQRVAAPLFDRPSQEVDYRSQIIADILNYFMSDYPNIQHKPFFEDYRKRSFLLGKSILISKNGETEEAIALDLEENFQIKVQYRDGSTGSLSSGEVSVKPDLSL